MYSKCYHAASQNCVILVLLAICKLCIRFRWSLYRFRPKSSHLPSGMLGLPSYCLVHHFSSGARICIAYHIPHIIHVLHHVACAFPVIDCGSVACVLVLGRAGRRVRARGTCWVRLRGSSFRQLWEPCKQDGHPSKSLLSLLASCSLYCYAAIPTAIYIMPPILPCQASNPPFLANCCLAMLPLLLSPSYSVASCRWSWSWFHVGTWIFWNITISLI